MSSGKKKGSTLSLCMIVKDEEAVLERCLRSVAGLVDQIVIVDTGSSDRTKEIAASVADDIAASHGLALGVTIADFEWCDDFGAARNAALAEAAGDWILHLDADEEFAAGDQELKFLLKDKYYWAYECKILYADSIEAIDRGTGAFYALRLFRRKPELVYHFPIHEQIRVPDRDRVARSEIIINHFGQHVADKERATRNIKLLNKAIEQYPNEGFFYSSLGSAYYNIKKYDLAVPLFDRALRMLDPRITYVPITRCKFSWSLYSVGDLQSAVSVLRELQAEHPRFTDAYFMEASIYIAEQNKDAAQRLLRTCMQLGEPPDGYPTLGGTGTWRASAALEAL